MTDHRYHVEGRSRAPREVVFDVLADGPGWERWAPGVSRASYERTGTPAPHGVGAIRRFGPRRGPVSREEVVAYDRPDHFAYRAISGPLPWRGYVAEVHLSPGPSGEGTAIEWTGTFSSWMPGLGPFIRRMVEGFVGGLVAESERRAGSEDRTGSRS